MTTITTVLLLLGASWLAGCSSTPPKAVQPTGEWVPVKSASAARPDLPPAASMPPTTPTIQTSAAGASASSSSVLTLARAISPTRRRGLFDVQVEDGDLASSVRRWVRESGQDLHWSVSVPIPVLAAARIEARDLPAALDQLVQALGMAGYRIGHAQLGREVHVFEKPGQYEVRPDDQVIATSVQRWGRAEGYDVLWETSIQADVDPGAAMQRVLAEDFRSALDRTLLGLQRLGYPIKAMVYADRVVRVVNKEQ